jgi:tRNA threonylcarbamoyladenosine biosynthesis protein TsaE
MLTSTMATTITTTSDQQTEQLGHAIAALLKPGTVLALYGDLGAGKTVFSRGLARGLGISEPVTSPTFTLVQEYRIDTGWFFHLDMYRIDDSDQALAFGIEDFLFAPDAITLVEWAERIDDLLEEPLGGTGRLFRINIAHAGENHRTITLPEELSGSRHI